MCLIWCETWQWVTSSVTIARATNGSQSNSDRSSTGRWRDQLHRLMETGCRVIFIVEGDLRATTINYDSLLGAVINAGLRKGSCVIRTVDLHETAAVVLTPPSVSKRERDCERMVCWTRMLMCVPTVSERIARKLLEEYGSLPAIKKALQSPKTFG